MGHYDDLYEQTAQDDYDRDVANHKEIIIDTIENLDLSDLKFISNIIKNIDDYRTFFKVLKKHIK